MVADRAIDQDLVASSDLVGIARHRPGTRQDLARHTALNETQLRKYTDEILAIVADTGEGDGSLLWAQRVDLDSDQRARVKSLQKQIRTYCEQNSIDRLKEKIAELEKKLDECADDTAKYCSLMRVSNSLIELL